MTGSGTVSVTGPVTMSVTLRNSVSDRPVTVSVTGPVRVWGGGGGGGEGG